MGWEFHAMSSPSIAARKRLRACTRRLEGPRRLGFQGLSLSFQPTDRPSGLQAEWRVAVGDQEEGVGRDAVVPADHALDEVEQ
jgi:hypothetical protein